LGGALERGGHWARAIGAYREALELQPGDARARLSLAIALCAWDDPADALEALQPWAGAPDGWQALPASQRALALYTYAYAEEQDGRPEQALAGYKRARESSQEAGEADLCGVAEQARLAAGRLGVLLRSLQPEGKRAAYERAATLCREGARKKAAALRDKDAFALARHDLWQAQEPAQQAQARAQEPLKSLYQAMRCFQDALLAEPKYGRAHRELGLCCLALVEPKAALAHLEAAAAYDPCSPLVLALLGESQLAAGGWEKALETFRRLLSLEPEYGPANLGFARAALRLHRSPNELDLARDALDRARALGADPRAVVKVREELDEAAARLKRGESLGAAVGPPRPPGAGPAAPEPVPIWRGSVLDW
jgi:tetratricopeptide (TPR) repeat protein